MGGGACVIIIGDTGNKAQAIKALCDGDLLTYANGPLVSQAFINRIDALNVMISEALSEAQDIAKTYA